MPIPQEQQRQINLFTEAIRKVIKEIDPTIKTEDKKIVGILIIQFPEDHAKTSKIDYIVIGKICFKHTIELLAEIYTDQHTERNPLAT